VQCVTVHRVELGAIALHDASNHARRRVVREHDPALPEARVPYQVLQRKYASRHKSGRCHSQLPAAARGRQPSGHPADPSLQPSHIQKDSGRPEIFRNAPHAVTPKCLFERRDLGLR
jgi:hypothetical protein